MKLVKDIVDELKGIVGKTQIIKDIHSGRLKAERVGMQFQIKNKSAEKYITERKTEAEEKK